MLRPSFPKFSVLLPVYWKADPHELKRCLDSLSSQTILPSETIVVEDGPLPHELREVLINADSQLNVWRYPHPEHRGLGQSLNDGLMKCKYEWVARMDADDISAQDRFEKQLKFLMEHGDISVVGGMLRESKPETRSGSSSMLRSLPTYPEKLRNFAKFRNPINHPTVMYHKQSVIEVGGYRDFPFFEDYELWTRMMIQGKRFANLNIVLVDTVADKSYFERRQGSKYRAAEKVFAKELRRSGFHSFGKNLAFRVSRIPLRFLPISILYSFYTRLLRKRSPKVD